jgi:hypothetical protein
MGDEARETYEVQARTPDGTLLRLGPLRSAIDVGLLARRYLAEGRAVQVELHRTRDGHAVCLSVLAPGMGWRAWPGGPAEP